MSSGADLGSIEATARSADHAVTVTVGAGGALRRVDIAEDAKRRGAARLRANILEAARKATSKANYLAQELLRERMGRSGPEYAASAGLRYDPALLDEDDELPGAPR